MTVALSIVLSLFDSSCWKVVIGDENWCTVEGIPPFVVTVASITQLIFFY
jgi:hypothetical protein